MALTLDLAELQVVESAGKRKKTEVRPGKVKGSKMKAFVHLLSPGPRRPLAGLAFSMDWPHQKMLLATHFF